MGEVGEALNEALEKARESKLNTIVAACVAVIATFMSLCSVKAGNIAQQMSQAQSNAVDQWSYYQAKSTKENIAQASVDQLTIERDVAPSLDADRKSRFDHAIEKQSAAAKRYQHEKEDIKTKAQAFERQFVDLDVHNDQFDMAEATLSVALALLGVTALTQKRWMLAVAGAFAAFGVFMGVCGFAKLSFHPDWINRFLS
jgi:hypothetical protein